MKFIYPQFLWALSVLLIPIIVHFFNFRRIRRVYFSQVALLKALKVETNTFRRLKEWLILAARLLFLAALVLAFAQPYLPSPNQQKINQPDGLISLYVDNSYSMQNEVGNEKQLDLATRLVGELVRVFPKSTSFQLITNQFENKEQYPMSSAQMEDRLTEVKFSNTPRDLATVDRRQRKLAADQSTKLGQQIFWFSDFQKSTTGNLNQIKLDSLSSYYLIPLPADQQANVYVDSVWMANPFVKLLETNQLNVRLKNTATEAKEGLVLKLFVDNRQVSTTNINLAAQSQATANFSFTLDSKGWKSCKIVFDDFPIAFDNEYFFALDAAAPVNILQVSQTNTSNFVGVVFSNENSFVVENANANNLDYNRIAQANLVVLNEVDRIEGEMKTQLLAFLKAGGVMAIFPPLTPGESFMGFLKAIGAANVQVNKDLNSKDNNTANYTLESTGLFNPFYKGVFDKIPTNIEMPSVKPVLQWSNQGENILTYKNKSSYLAAFALGSGKAYLFAAPLQTALGNFARHALFVPTMYQMASNSRSALQRLAYTFDEKNIRLRLKGLRKNQVYKLVGEQYSFVPAQRVVDQDLLLEMPEQSIAAGHYKLVGEQGTEAVLAFNFNKEESELACYTTDELKSVFAKFKNVQFLDLKQSANFIANFKEKNLQISLWKYFLWGALFFLLIEILLIRFMP